MCWYINKDKFEKSPEDFHKIADKDLTVYKLGYRDEEIFTPYYEYCFKYEPNVLNKEIKLRKEYEDSYEYMFINEGYHSYSKKCYYQKEIHSPAVNIMVRKYSACDIKHELN